MSTIKLNKQIRYYIASKKQLAPLHLIDAGEPIHVDDLCMMKLGEKDVPAVSISLHHHRFYILFDDLGAQEQNKIRSGEF